MHQTYGVDFVIFPPFIKKKITIFPPIITVANSTSWLSNIGASVTKLIRDERAVLVVAETIDSMRLISAYLNENLHITVRQYGAIDCLDPTIVLMSLQAGHVVVATNLGGRGTHFTFTKRVELQGGLHVIMSFVAASGRVGAQGNGRVSRAGLPGSAQLIANIPAYPDKPEANTDILASRLGELRDSEEKLRLIINDACKVPAVLMEDDLFGKYVDMIRAEDSPTKLVFIIQPTKCKVLLDTEACVYLGHSPDSVYVAAVDGQSVTKDFEITDYLKFIDPVVHKHITYVLNSPTDVQLKLSKRDYEIIHFLLAKHGYGDSSAEVIKRLTHLYRTSFQDNTKHLSPQGLAIYNAHHSQFAKILNYFFDRTAIPMNDDRAELMSTFEISFLENHLKLSNSSYNPIDLTEKALMNIRLLVMYDLWKQDRSIYTYEFELLQIEDDWAIWLKNESVHYLRNDTCVQLATKIYSGISRSGEMNHSCIYIINLLFLLILFLI